MTENIAYRLLENIIPLLFTIVILFGLIYFLIKKITSPFSTLGNLLYDRFNKFSERITQSRKDKLKRQIESLNIQLSDLEEKYSRKTHCLLEIKDRLNGLSRNFTELNQSEMRRNILNASAARNDAALTEQPDGGNFFVRLAGNWKKRRLSNKNKKLRDVIKKNEDIIAGQKELIGRRIDELVMSISNLTD